VRYYNGRYLHEDLLHELYLGFLKVSPQTILEFHERNRLHNIGLWIIKSIYQSRKCLKKYNTTVRKGGDSPLSETSAISIELPDDLDIFYNIGNEQEDIDISPRTKNIFKDIEVEREVDIQRRKHETRLDTLNTRIWAEKDNEKVQLMIMCVNEGIPKVAQRMETSEYYIRKDFNEIKETLKLDIA